MPYQSQSELTFRAVFSGLFVGCLIGASNVCIGLKIGWTFGASITAAVISFAIFKALVRPKRPYTEGENLISATAGSSSGTMASAGGFVSAIPALEMIRAQNGHGQLSIGVLMLWAIAVAFLGVHFAVPLRRQMVIVDKLRYPTGTAAAETIKAMYASGAEALAKTKFLIWAAVIAAAIKFAYEFGPGWLSGVEFFSFDDVGLAGVAVLGLPLYQVSIGFNLSPMMFGAGILIGPKVGWSLFAGAVVAWGIITPVLLDRGVVEVSPDMQHVASERGVEDAMFRAQRLAEHRDGVSTADVVRHYTLSAVHGDMQAAKKADKEIDVTKAVGAYDGLLGAAGIEPIEVAKVYRGLLIEANGDPDAVKLPPPTLTDPPHTSSPYRAGFNWVLWAGVALMVVASLMSLALQYKTLIRTFSSLKGAAKGGAASADDEEDAPDPYPMKNWLIGMVLATTLTAVLADILFDIPVYMGVLAVILSLVIAAIACRATGETDINPVGAMGKITQVVYGGLAPGHMQVNLMAAAITSAGASQAGDLMHDLKAGYLLKVSVRRQVTTQLIGVVVGVFAAALTYRVLTMAYAIPGDKFPGPSVFAWAKMAELLAKGFAALPPGAMWGAAVGAGAGLLIPIVGKLFPKVNKWLPSPVAFGIAFMVPAQYSIGMWLGAMLTWLYARSQPDRAERYGASLASGLIAGEGLMMVAIAIYIITAHVLLAG